jgi:hypothetical protein
MQKGIIIESTIKDACSWSKLRKWRIIIVFGLYMSYLNPCHAMAVFCGATRPQALLINCHRNVAYKN